MDFGYEDEVLFPLKLHVAKEAKAGPATLHAKVDWLVCRETCIPGKAELEVQRKWCMQWTLDLGNVPAPLFRRFFDLIPKELPANFKVAFQPSSTGFRLASPRASANPLQNFSRRSQHPQQSCAANCRAYRDRPGPRSEKGRDPYRQSREAQWRAGTVWRSRV